MKASGINKSAYYQINVRMVNIMSSGRCEWESRGNGRTLPIPYDELKLK